MNWDDVQRMKRVEAKVEELGMKFTAESFGMSWAASNGGSESICLRPKDDCLPHYSRDARIFAGTLEQIEVWLKGVEWARGYDDTLKLSNNEKRTAKEQAERSKHLMKTIKTGKLVTGKLGGEHDIVEDEEDDEFDHSYGYADDGGSGAYA